MKTRHIIGCHFSASGKNFDVDAFLRSNNMGRTCTTFYRGQATELPNWTCDANGFSIIVNTDFGDLRSQLRDALRFLKKRNPMLLLLAGERMVSERRLTFTYCESGKMLYEYLSPELIVLAGNLSIGIALSIYP